MIVARNIHKTFGALKVLRGVDLRIKRGAIFGLAGRSGAGKSTFLRCINGLEPYDHGHLAVDGVDVKGLPARALRAFRKNIGMVFQNFSLLERLTVEDNVALPLKCWKHKGTRIDRRVRELLGLVGLEEKIGQKPRALSGGQKQRVAVARALALEPRILLCDEATSALDPKTAQEIIALLRDINRRLGITIIMVTHQMVVLSGACDEVAILEDGRVETHGPVDRIFRQPPPALRNLLGAHQGVGMSGGRTVTIALSAGGDTATAMAADLGIEITIVGRQKPFQDNGACRPVLRFAEDDLPALANYLAAGKTAWRMIEEPEPELQRVG